MVEAARQRVRWRAIVAIIVVALVVASGALYVNASLKAPLPVGTIEVAVPAVAPGAASAFTMPANGASLVSVTGPEDFAAMAGTGEILASAGGEQARPIASLTKIITALAILDAKPLGADDAGPTISFTKSDVDLYEKYYVLGATLHSMKPGTSLSERDALKVMLVGSASNYAEAVSTWAFGSQDRFRSGVRSWLDARGLTATRIVEPTGIDPRNVSTPAELLAIAKLAMADPVISAIVQMPRLDIPGHNADGNTNTLLGTLGVNGLKTGTLEGYGSNLLYSASLDVGLSAPLSITGVVLGGFDGTSVAREVTTLLKSIAAGLHDVTLIELGSDVGTVTTPWGETAGICADSRGNILTWSDTPITVDVTTRDDVRQGKKGTRVGTITYTAGEMTEEVQLALATPLTSPSTWWRLTNPGELLGW